MVLSQEYINLAFFKSMIQSTDTQDDTLYQQFVDGANRKVSTAIFRYIDIPLDDVSDNFDSAKNAALAFARHLLSIDIELIEKSKTYLEFYNVELYGAGGTEDDPMAGGLIQELIAQRNNRTVTILARFDPREFKVPLPSQNDLFVSQRFG
jgi:hypothetical protein